MKLMLSFALLSGMYAQNTANSVAPSAAQTTQSKRQPSKREDAPRESAEHALVRQEHERVEHYFDDSQKEYNEALRRDPTCKTPEPISHPVTRESLCGEEMLGCQMPTCLALLNLEKAREALERLEYKLAHVDDCVKTYRGTIDKKISNLTTREVLRIKVCRSAELYPPPTK